MIKKMVQVPAKNLLCLAYFFALPAQGVDSTTATTTQLTAEEIARAQELYIAQRIAQIVTTFIPGVIMQKKAAIQDIEKSAFGIASLRKKIDDAQKVKNDLVNKFFGDPKDQVDRLSTATGAIDTAKTALDAQAAINYFKTYNTPNGDLYAKVYHLLNDTYLDGTINSRLTKIAQLKREITELVAKHIEEIQKIGEKIDALTETEQLTSGNLLNAYQQAKLNISSKEAELQVSPDPQTDARAAIKVKTMDKLKEINKEIRNYEQEITKNIQSLPSGVRTNLRQLTRDVQGYDLILDLMSNPKRLLTLSVDDIILYSGFAACN